MLEEEHISNTPQQIYGWIHTIVVGNIPSKTWKMDVSDSIIPASVIGKLLFVCIFQRSTASIHVKLVSFSSVAVIIHASIEFDTIRLVCSTTRSNTAKSISVFLLNWNKNGCITCHCHWAFDSWDVLIVSVFPDNFNMTNERQNKYAYRVQIECNIYEKERKKLVSSVANNVDAFFFYSWWQNLYGWSTVLARLLEERWERDFNYSKCIKQTWCCRLLSWKLYLLIVNIYLPFCFATSFILLSLAEISRCYFSRSLSFFGNLFLSAFLSFSPPICYSMELMDKICCIIIN